MATSSCDLAQNPIAFPYDLPDPIAEAQQAAERKRRIEELRQRLEKCGIPIRHIEAKLSNFETPTEDHRAALQTAKTYAERFRDRNALPASCLLLLGRPGTGKTHLAVGIARQVAAVFGIRYATVSGIARDVRSSYSKLATETEKEILERHISPSLLVLDEVGVGLGTDHERAMIHDVLAGRYDRRKPTIMISNLTMPEFKGALGDRIVDRIREDVGIVLQCPWESWRGRP